MPAGMNLGEFSQDEPVETRSFRELIGSLLWLTIQTRPDTMNSGRVIARYCAGPREIHWKT